ncbi:MAG: hypothetical protein RLN76_09620 [Phycisphaeraceae bacterium]
MDNDPLDPRDKPEFWFPKKKNGYGWGLPVRREGWWALGAFLVLDGLLLTTLLWLPPVPAVALILTGSAILSAALITVCAIKGER